MTKLKGRRKEQLLLLQRKGAISRETAVATGFGGGDDQAVYSGGTLSRMFDEGLVSYGYLPVHGDSRRRVAHYWLTEAGLKAIEAAQ